MEPTNPKGGRDRLTGRESAYDLLRAAESPAAEQYRADYEEASRVCRAIHEAIVSKDVPPHSPSDQLETIPMTPEEYRTLQRLAKEAGLPLDDYIRTVMHAPVKAYYPDQPWK